MYILITNGLTINILFIYNVKGYIFVDFGLFYIHKYIYNGY